jgi:chorismate mutase-like protein
MSLLPSQFPLASPAAVVPLAAFALLLLGSLLQKPSDDVSGLHLAAADRLALIPDVARHKWNTAAAIADPEREQRLIEAAIVKGRQVGLPDHVTRVAIEAQIIASKQMQEELIQSWRGQGQGRFTSIPKFIEETRPKIEETTDRLIRELSVALRVLNTCPAATALRQPPPRGLVSNSVWTTAVEGLIQSAGGPTADACPPR